MYKIINVQKKENKNTAFFFETFNYPKNFFEHIDQKYKKTGKLLFFKRTISENNLTNTNITGWKSRRDFLDYLTDPYMYDFLSKATNYDIDNDISNFIIIEEEENE